MDNTEEKYFLTRGKTILFGFILLVVILIFVFIKIGSSNSNEKYKDFESELKSAAENYYIINDMDLDEGEEIRVSIEQLSNKNLVYNDLKDKCKGYVIILNEEDYVTGNYELVYRAYIKCGNKYMSSNYSEY